MAKEFLWSFQDFFNAHKQNSNAIFCNPSSKQLCKSIKSNQVVQFCWLLAGWLITQHGAGYQSALAWVISCAGTCSTGYLKHVGNDHKECFKSIHCAHIAQYVLCWPVKVPFLVNKALLAWKCAIWHLKCSFPFDLAHEKLYKFRLRFMLSSG